MKKLLALALTVLLVACSTAEPAPEPIKFDFTKLGKIYLDTQDLRIINRAGSTQTWPPYVDQKFKPTLTDAVYQMANDRLQAIGDLGHATLIIRDANVTEQPLSTSSDFESLFTRQQASRYIGRVEVSLEAQTPSDGSVGIADANAVHSVTLPENPTENEKYEAYRVLVTELMDNLNRNLKQAIQAHMSRFLATGAQGKRTRPAPDSSMPPMMDER